MTSERLHAVRRDRHGRGPRGPLMPPGVPAFVTPSQMFDDIVQAAVEQLDRRCGRALAGITFGVEDAPRHLEGLRAVPFAVTSLSRRAGLAGPFSAVVTIFRRPLQTRATGTEDLRAMVRDVLAEQVAAILGCPAEEVDPDYGS